MREGGFLANAPADYSEFSLIVPTAGDRNLCTQLRLESNAQKPSRMMITTGFLGFVDDVVEACGDLSLQFSEKSIVFLQITGGIAGPVTGCLS